MTLEHEGAAAPSRETAAAYLDAEPRERNKPDAADSTGPENTLGYARRLIELGLFLFPTKADEKAPAVTGWQQKSTRDLATIEGWVRRGWNLGIDTEKSGVVGIDEDATGHLDVWKERCEVAPGRTFTARSQSGRRHELYRPPGGRLFRSSSARFKAAGLTIDVKARGGLLMAPGSEFPSGAYSIADDVPIAELPEEVADEWLVPVEEISPAYVDGLGPQPTFLASEEPREQPLSARAVAWLDAVLGGEEERLRAAQDLGDGEEPRWRQLTLDVANRYVLVHNAAPDTFPLDALRDRFLDAAPTDRDWTEANNEDRWLDAIADVGGWAKPLPEHVLDASGDFGDLGPDESAGTDPMVLSDAEARLLDGMDPLDWDELLDGEVPPEDWIVWPFAQRGELSAVFARGKAGKSFLMYQACAEAAMGRPQFGIVPPGVEQRPVSVVYIDQENPLKEIKKRATLMGHTPDELRERFHYYSFAALGALDDFGNLTGPRKLVALAKRHRADVVVIDTVSRFITDEENNSKSWLAMNKLVYEPLKAMGVAIIRLDHTGQDVKKGARGSTAKEGDADRGLLLEKAGDHMDAIRTLTRDFARSGEGPEKVVWDVQGDPTRNRVLAINGQPPQALDDFSDLTVEEVDSDTVQELVELLARLDPDRRMTRDEQKAALRDADIKFGTDALTRARAARGQQRRKSS